MNYPLYYPEEANDGRESFFAIIFKLVNDRKVPAFRYNERTEKFNKEDSFFIFRTRHGYEYRCPDCGLTFRLTN